MALLRPFITVLCLCLLGTPSLAEPDFKFSTAKKILERDIYQDEDERISFYCGCTYSDKKQVNSASCGYEPRKNAKRGQRIEWEHVVPASRFGSYRACWQEGHPACTTSKGKAYKGRRCCTKVDPEFAMMEADLNNLVPAVGELNGDRSNYRMAILDGETRSYGACDFEIDFAADLMEPDEPVRGDIARTYFYMQATYGLELTQAEQDMFEQWRGSDPISEWELERNAKIQAAQGNGNPYVGAGF
ncbi:endonuclease [Flexibacterium corallicola]|uniref:endonuclease n=1 Tax=Flexibacterium corallicola TaxID=3037259 RepID=UPI00286F0B3A|nr:endonuclease [Pseudovibrio sp. M1P-2-3]